MRGMIRQGLKLFLVSCIVFLLLLLLRTGYPDGSSAIAAPTQSDTSVYIVIQSGLNADAAQIVPKSITVAGKPVMNQDGQAAKSFLRDLDGDTLPDLFIPISGEYLQANHSLIGKEL